MRTRELLWSVIGNSGGDAAVELSSVADKVCFLLSIWSGSPVIQVYRYKGINPWILRERKSCSFVKPGNINLLPWIINNFTKNIKSIERLNQGSPMDRPLQGAQGGGGKMRRASGSMENPTSKIISFFVSFRIRLAKKFWKKPWFGQFGKFCWPFPGGVGGTTPQPPIGKPWT